MLDASKGMAPTSSSGSNRKSKLDGEALASAGKMIWRSCPLRSQVYQRLVRDAVEKDTHRLIMVKKAWSTYSRQFHIGVEENDVVVAHLGDAISALFGVPRFQECIDRLGSCFESVSDT